MEAKFGPSDKNIKTDWYQDVNRDETFQRNSGVRPLWPHSKEEILEDLKVEPVDEKLRRYKSICI